VENILSNVKVSYRKQIARQHLCRQEFWPEHAVGMVDHVNFSSLFHYQYHAKSGCCSHVECARM